MSGLPPTSGDKKTTVRVGIDALRAPQEELLALAKRQHRLDQDALLRTFNSQVSNRQVRRHYARIMEKRRA